MFSRNSGTSWGCTARWVREWLRQQTAAGILEHRDDHFGLSPEAEQVFAREEVVQLRVEPERRGLAVRDHGFDSSGRSISGAFAACSRSLISARRVYRDVPQSGRSGSLRILTTCIVGRLEPLPKLRRIAQSALLRGSDPLSQVFPGALGRPDAREEETFGRPKSNKTIAFYL